MNLTPLGIVHTAISLVALLAGLVELVRTGEIDPRTSLGKVYLVTTLLTCLTALGIFRHGGFGPPHALAVLTIACLAVGGMAAYTRNFGRASTPARLVAMSSTFLFSLIPAITETATRLPAGAPLVASADAPILGRIFGVLFLLSVIGVAFQLRRARAARS